MSDIGNVTCCRLHFSLSLINKLNLMIASTVLAGLFMSDNGK